MPDGAQVQQVMTGIFRRICCIQIIRALVDNFHFGQTKSLLITEAHAGQCAGRRIHVIAFTDDLATGIAIKIIRMFGVGALLTLCKTRPRCARRPAVRRQYAVSCRR